MGSAQSRARSKLQCIFPTSDYAQLPSSPSKEHLLIDDALNYYNLPEQYETAIRGILTETTISVKKIAVLEYKIERLVSKNMALEENFRKRSVEMKKVIELERTVEGLLSKNALMEKIIKENTTTVNRIAKVENKAELEERFMLLDNKTAERNHKAIIASEKKVAELDKEFVRIEKLLLSDGLVLISPTQNYTQDLELDKGVEEPEYVNRMMGLILLLIFVVFVLIGMQL